MSLNWWGHWAYVTELVGALGICQGAHNYIRTGHVVYSKSSFRTDFYRPSKNVCYIQIRL